MVHFASISILSVAPLFFAAVYAAPGGYYANNPPVYSGIAEATTTPSASTDLINAYETLPTIPIPLSSSEAATSAATPGNYNTSPPPPPAYTGHPAPPVGVQSNSETAPSAPAPPPAGGYSAPASPPAYTGHSAPPVGVQGNGETAPSAPAPPPAGGYSAPASPPAGVQGNSEAAPSPPVFSSGGGYHNIPSLSYYPTVAPTASGAGSSASCTEEGGNQYPTVSAQETSPIAIPSYPTAPAYSQAGAEETCTTAPASSGGASYPAHKHKGDHDNGGNWGHGGHFGYGDYH